MYFFTSNIPDRGFQKIPIDDDSVLMKELLEKVLIRRKLNLIKGGSKIFLPCLKCIVVLKHEFKLQLKGTVKHRSHQYAYLNVCYLLYEEYDLEHSQNVTSSSFGQTLTA